MAQEQVKIIKRELEQSLERATEMQYPLNNQVQGLNRELELSQNFFFDNNVDWGQQQLQQQQHFIPKETIHRSSLPKKDRYSPTKVKSRNFLTNISDNRLKHIDFDNASFIIDCFTYRYFST